MNEAVKKQLEAVAFSVALEKASNNEGQSGASMGKADFNALCETVSEELKRVVNAIEAGQAVAPTKPKRTARKAPAYSEPKGTKRTGIEPEAMKAYLGKSQEGAATLQQIADNFKVSKGVAQRALEKLSVLHSAPGPAGKRGKAPMVYWTE